ncbi:MAG: ABC transporter ATP-binding protein [Planctomycetota bacterium]|nr:ABC transporter ATP-binding protein [Planctomycetota bacterium]
MESNDIAVCARDVHLSFGRTRVLRGVDLDVPRGVTTVLLGANGEGKTTLLGACLGILARGAGRLDVLGLDPQRDPSELRTRIGYVPSTPDAYDWMRVADWFALLRPHYPTWNDELALDLVVRLDVPRTTRFGQMSRGQGMKAMLAAALAPNPELLLLDEPFGGLDPLVREEVLRNVIAALGAEPRTVLLCTHDLDVAARVADRVAVLAGGRIVREGPVEDFAGGDDEAATPERLRLALAAAIQREVA